MEAVLTSEQSNAIKIHTNICALLFTSCVTKNTLDLSDKHMYQTNWNYLLKMINSQGNCTCYDNWNINIAIQP
jgi:hypothetical protein